MTNDVATNAIPGNPVKNGYIVTSVLPTGTFEDRATPAPGENQSVGNLQSDLTNRLNDTGATPVRLE
jgi:hypothetical protein